MSLFRRAGRAIDGGSAPERRGAEIMGWPRPAEWANPGYAQVTPTAGNTAERSVAIMSSVDLITSLITELPVDIYSGKGAAAKEVTMPGYLQDPSGEGFGLADWGVQLLSSWMLRGNNFGNVLERSRGGAGYPTQVQILNTECVRVQVESDGRYTWWVGGQQVTDMWHTRANARGGQLFGLSVIGQHAASIGLNIVGTQFGLQWFTDGAHPGGMLVNEQVELKPDQAKTAKDRFMAALRGTREPVVLGKGWKYQQIQISPEESQFLDTNKYSSAECCRMFGPGLAEMLGYETGSNLTYQTVESKAVQLNVYTLGKWMTRYERVLTAMLPNPQYAVLNRKAILQTTTMERYKAYEVALKNQWQVVNEVRELENEPPVPWGNEPTSAASAAPDPAADPNVDPSGVAK